MKYGFVLGSTLSLLGCEAGGPQQDPAGARPAAPGAPAASLTARRAPAGAAEVKWPSNIQWRGWEEGLAEARRDGKGIVLVVYADWCPRCRELAPVFEGARIGELSQRLVMIRQNADEAPAWLTQRFEQQGSYVPRVMVLDSTGALRPEISSGNPRFPYFYTPAGVKALELSLERAATRS